MNELNKFDIKRKETAEIIFGFTLTTVFKEVFKVIKGIDIISGGGCNETVEECAGMGSSWTSRHKPVFSTQGKGPYDIFDSIVIDFKTTILQVGNQFLPSLMDIIQSFACNSSRPPINFT